VWEAGCMKVHISSALPVVPSHLTLFPALPSSDLTRSDQLNEHCPVSQPPEYSRQPILQHLTCIAYPSNPFWTDIQLFSQHREPTKGVV